MRHRCPIPVLLFGAVLTITVLLPALASTQTTVGFNNENRTVLALRVSEAGLQKWVPAQWQSNPTDSGPSKGANALLVFINPWLTQDAEGKPTAVPINRRVALAIPAKNQQTGEATSLVARIYVSDAQALPGPYKNSVAATVRLEQTVKGTGVEPATGSELWEMRNGDGGTIGLRMRMSHQGFTASLGEHGVGRWIAVFYQGRGGHEPVAAAAPRRRRRRDGRCSGRQ
jgi:hypothetical protein